MPRFLCMSRENNAMLYEAETLPQARGFVEGTETPCRIACELDLIGSTECYYRIVVIDEPTGQVVAEGPIVDLFEAPDAVAFLKLVLMPINSGKEVTL